MRYRQEMSGRGLCWSGDLTTARLCFSTAPSSLQATEEEVAPSLDAKEDEDAMAAPPLQVSTQELASEFISV